MTLTLAIDLSMLPSMMFAGKINPADFWAILFVVFGIIQFLAFIEGARVMFGLNLLIAVLAFFAAGMIPIIGGLIIIYVGYVGATRGWKLPWWAAIMIIWPGLVWAFYGYASLGLDVVIERLG